MDAWIEKLQCIATMPPSDTAVAGVLVLLYQHQQQWHLLLTKRALTLRSHAGEISFAGGMIEPQDQGDSAMAALRETQEELGIQALPCLLGALPAVRSRRGTSVQPWLAYLPSKPELAPSADEVAEVLHWPVTDWLAREPKWQPITHAIQGPEWRLQSHRIWGLTAFVLHGLREQVRA
ncbi:NUDIX hydrolase [Salinibius halmophilus]|uniref:NUDIX hydrolase n=1 Tax=Salinibius halmophilus TaxID=1853216 RepID=UPI000E672376|nr:CoA pyrophosphatase [Salinibius halmophilus]